MAKPTPEAITAAQASQIATGIPASVQLAQWALNMFPSFAALDLVDRRYGYPETSGQRRPILGTCPNSDNVDDGKYAGVHVDAANNSVVRHPVLHVFSVSCPPQIANIVVQPIAIVVSDLDAIRLRIGQKSESNKPVHTTLPPLRLCVDGRNNVALFVDRRLQDAANVRSLPSALASNPSKRANRIFRRERDNLPKFCGIIDISHGAVPSHWGQGRAACLAPFRPANDSLFAAPIQRKAA